MKLAIIGIQGSGKGTQAKLLAKEFKLKRIAVGELARKEIKKKTKQGKILERYMSKGLLAPNKIINRLILENLPEDNFIIDGFPRDTKQLKTAKKIDLDKVIILTLPKKEVYRRIKLRKKLECRTDDGKKFLETRLKIFYNHSPKIIKYFKKKLIKINGNQSRKKVFSKIKKSLKNKKFKGTTIEG